MYSCSPTLSQISLKNSFEKVFFQILAKIEMTRNKNRFFGRHFETVQHFQFFFWKIAIFYSPYIYGANFIAKFQWESGFLKGGSMNPPWAPTGVEVPWSLKATNGRQKTYEIFHVYCIFYSGFMCQTTVIFWNNERWKSYIKYFSIMKLFHLQKPLSKWR